MPHLLVFLPGIGGSRLRDRLTGRLIWGIDGVRRPVRHKEIARADADLWDPDFDDGIEADGLLAISVPGLTRVKGSYQGLRDRLANAFALDEENHLEFPYDWRRPCSFTSALLAKDIARKLAVLRRRSPGAKVIIVAHSMGGLVALHYLREHDRDHDCIRLITLGTPFRGAVKAAGALADGLALGPFRAFQETLLRLPSVHELLPLYPAIVDCRGPEPLPAERITALAGAVALDTEKVEAARAFLAGLNGPLDDPWRLQPVAGFGSRTPQAGLLRPTGLTVSPLADLLPPEYVEDGPPDGDGTVPIWSAEPAIPGVLTQYVNQSHLGMVGGRQALSIIVNLIRGALRASREHDPFLGPRDPLPAGAPKVPLWGPRLDTDVRDVYPLGGRVVVTGRAVGWRGGLWGGLDSREGRRPAVIGHDGSFEIDFGEVEEGLHTLTLTEREHGPEKFLDVIEVA